MGSPQTMSFSELMNEESLFIRSPSPGINFDFSEHQETTSPTRRRLLDDKDESPTPPRAFSPIIPQSKPVVAEQPKITGAMNGLVKKTKKKTLGGRDSRRSSRIAIINEKREEKVPAKPTPIIKAKRGRPKGSRNKPPKPAKPFPRAEIYEVQKVLDCRIDPRTLEHEYRVKWKGFQVKDATWEPAGHLKGAIDAILAFETSSKVKVKK